MSTEAELVARIQAAEASEQYAEMVNVLTELGALMAAEQRLDEATDSFRAASEAAVMAGDTLAEGNSLRRAGKLALARQEYDQARSLLNKARTSQSVNGDLSGLAETLKALAALHRAQGNNAAADELAADAAHYEQLKTL